MTTMDHYKKILLVIAIFFIITRLFGLGQIYHQDEYRWATIANPFFGQLQSPHPPLTTWSLKAAGRILGFNHLRVVPLAFSLINLLLLYAIASKISGKRAVGLTAAGLFAVSVYAAIANLQVDIDGAILPFSILLTYWAYLNLKETPPQFGLAQAGEGRARKFKWLALFAAALAVGFLTKLSYLLFLGALILDYGLDLWLAGKINSKNIKKFTLGLGLIVVLGGLFYYFYTTHLHRIITYAEHFRSLNFSSRSYFDLAFKVSKSLVWLSPLLALPVVYGLFRREVLLKYKVWFLYLLANALFYLVVFDFAKMTVERYLMFLIVPCLLISAQVIHDWWLEARPSGRQVIWAVVGVVVFSAIALSLHYDILPLDPKHAYAQHVKHLNFNFLIPLTGGSGPSGFYSSAQYIIWSWIVAAAAIAAYIFKPKFRRTALAVFLALGLGYNVLFLNEYLTGAIYGNVARLSRQTIDYVNSNTNIPSVITYYDIGAYYLKLNGKYSGRFYSAPSRDYSLKLTDYRGYYMVVDFPAIDRFGPYWPLLARCPITRQFQDGQISSYIFDCRQIK